MNEEKSIKLLDEFFEKTSDEILDEYIRRVNKMDIADDVAFEEYIKYLNEIFNNSLEEKEISNMKYKIGDRVRIKSFDWYNQNKDEDGFVRCGDKVFDDYMSVFCGSVVTIRGIYAYIGYDIQEDMQCRTWTDEMIEGIADVEPQEKMVSLEKVVDEFRHFIINYFSNLFPTGEEVKYVTDLFRKRLEK